MHPCILFAACPYFSMRGFDLIRLPAGLAEFILMES